MLLTRLLADVEVVETRGPVDGVEIHAVDFDSRRARLGSLFCCVPGATTDGHDHAAEAVRGVGAVLGDPVVVGPDHGVMQIGVGVGDHRLMGTVGE